MRPLSQLRDATKVSLETAMDDVLYLVIAAGLFALTMAFGALCAHLMGEEKKS